jgi:putative phosphoribosyl transferase
VNVPREERPFKSRLDAGEQLAERVAALHLRDPIVLALPRGGVVVAEPVARRLDAPLDVFVVRKLGFPGQSEFAMGAIAEDGTVVLDAATVSGGGLHEADVERVLTAEREELRRRVIAYRGGAAPSSLAARAVVLVDDGIATGNTALAAIRGVRALGASQIVLAAPVASRTAVQALAAEVDDLVVLLAPANLRGVGEWYLRFDQVSDKEVIHVASVHTYDPKDKLLKVGPGSGGVSAQRTELEGV